MASCNIPTTIRAGFAFLEYGPTTGIAPHKVSVGLKFPVTPYDLGIILPEVLLWADALGRCLPTDYTITGWGTQDPDHGSVYAASLLGPVVGTHATASGATDLFAPTVTLTGKGLGGPGDCSGQTRHMFFCGRAFRFTIGQKAIGAGVDGNLDDLATFLATNTILWADFYGQSAGVRGKYPVQHNAAAQRRLGS